MLIALILSLIGCNDTNTQDLRRQWTLYTPSVSFNQREDLAWSSPESMRQSLVEASEEWKLNTSCMFDPRPSEEHANVIFVCADVANSAGPDSEKISSSVLNGVTTVTIDESLCSNVGPALARHAWGHALGFHDVMTWNSTQMDGLDVLRENDWKIDTVGWDPMEVDGFRIWANNNGASGCGDDELEWSWISNPELYSGEPPELSRLLTQN